MGWYRLNINMIAWSDPIFQQKHNNQLAYTDGGMMT